MYIDICGAEEDKTEKGGQEYVPGRRGGGQVLQVLQGCVSECVCVCGSVCVCVCV